jgi:hypothetical protein
LTVKIFPPATAIACLVRSRIAFGGGECEPAHAGNAGQGLRLEPQRAMAARSPRAGSCWWHGVEGEQRIVAAQAQPSSVTRKRAASPRLHFHDDPPACASSAFPPFLHHAAGRSTNRPRNFGWQPVQTQRMRFISGQAGKGIEKRAPPDGAMPR